MTKTDLLHILHDYKAGKISDEGILTVVDAYSSVSNNGKPIVMPSFLAFKERRLKLYLSLRDAAKGSTVSAATISRIERGKEVELSNALKLDAFYAKNGA